MILDSDGQTYLLRAAQQQLLESEMRLKALFDGIADAITVVNPGGIIITQNQATHRILGYGPRTLLGVNVFRLIHVDDLFTLHSAFFSVLEGFNESAIVQCRHQTPDGTFRKVEASVGRCHIASTQCVVFCFRPISARPPELVTNISL